MDFLGDPYRRRMWINTIQDKRLKVIGHSGLSWDNYGNKRSLKTEVHIYIRLTLIRFIVEVNIVVNNLVDND